MTRGIRQVLVASFGFSVLLIVGLVAYHAYALKKLDHLYQQTMKRSVDMEVATDSQHIGEDLYLVIANAAINRDFVTSARLWKAVKNDSSVKLQKLADSADVPYEEARVKQAKLAFEEIVQAYENEMLPLLEKGAPIPGPIVDIDERIDRRVVEIDTALQALAKSESDENQVAALEFDSVLKSTNRLGLLVSLIGIGAAIASFAVTTRLIARPLAEMTRAVLEVRKGNYEIAIAHDSGDAAGALAEALEGMLGEVKTRTDEMERSNERLLREIGDRRQAEAQLQQAYDELRAASRVAAMAKGMQSGERMSDADFEEMASVLKMTRSATNARQCGLRILAEARRAREAEAMLTG